MQRPLGFPLLLTSRFLTTPHFAVELQERILHYCTWQDRFRLFMAGVLIPGGETYTKIKDERQKQLIQVIAGLKIEVQNLRRMIDSAGSDFRRKRQLTLEVRRYDRRIRMADQIINKN